MANAKSDFWAIAPYYNLAGWKSRPRNYRLFRESLSIPLLTVEWHPDGAYDLGPTDADRLVQVEGGDPMWQKERLLDLALDNLPPHVKYVAWLDADVLFCDPDLLQCQSLRRQFKKSGHHFKRSISTSSLETIAALVAEGAGAGILPGRVAARQPGIEKHCDDAPVF